MVFISKGIDKELSKERDERVYSLNDKRWKLINEEHNINIDATVPGSVFEELIKNGVIEDPFYGLNESKVGWVYNSDWVYKLVFEFKEFDRFMKYEHLYLVFKGIDTIGQVRFNGEDLGPVDDMFMEWKWEIKDL
ncbi:MAG: glycosyl hydrolase 2 galactose-binding domain-containing protein, partial [Promethearchaeota archaeon]